MFVTSDALPSGWRVNLVHAREIDTEQARGSAEQENMMVKFGHTGTAVLALVIGLAAAHAQTTAVHQNKQRLRAAPPPVVAYEPNLPVDQAIRFGYSQGYATYPSGWGGIYGDGRYPDNTISNGRYNTLH